MDRVLTPGGLSYVQMPNKLGLRCLYHQARRQFREGTGFEVRYWSLSELRELSETVGPTEFSVDGFFGLGIQASDYPLMDAKGKLVIASSEALRAMSEVVKPLVQIADSVYVISRKPS